MTLRVNQLTGFGAPRRAAGGGGFTDPTDLFTGADYGFWYDFSDASTLWQDTSATSAVTTAGDDVRRVDDKSGTGSAHITEGTGAWEWQTNYMVRKDFATNDASFGTLDRSGVYTLFALIRWLDDTQSGYRGICAVNNMSMLLMRGGSSFFGTFGGTTWYPSTHFPVQDADEVLGMNWSGTGTGGTFYQNGSAAGTYAATDGQSASVGGFGSSQRSNMRVYQIFGINRELTTQELSDLQTWMAGKT